MKKKIAFTLAETLIVLVILGVVAAITIPTLVKRHQETSNKAKIKKAMTAYEAALSKIVVENNIKSDNGIDNFAGANCANSRVYFKQTRDGDDNCTFMTADGLWWNISDLKNPVISVDTKTGIDPTKLADLKNTAKDASDNKVYAMSGWFDNNGILRINDFKASMDNPPSEDIKIVLEKIYNFIGIPVTAVYSPKEMLDAFVNGDFDKPCENPDKRLSCTNCKSCYIMANNEIAYYDKNGKFLFLERKNRNDVAIN